LKWDALDYERRMIYPRRAWVGNDMIDQLKTDGLAAPVPLGELLAGALRDWHRDTLYAKADDWVFPSLKTAGANPKAACWQCHDDHAAVEHTFVQFYPTLKDVAKKFGTYRGAAKMFYPSNKCGIS
jgi:integrase